MKRLIKRDLFFTAERFAAALDERRIAILLRLHNVGKPSGTADAPAKLFASFLRKADEGTLGRALVEVAVLQSAHSTTDAAKTLHEAAELYKVDVAAITAKIKQEFAAKDKAKEAKKAAPKPAPKRTQKAAAA